jgi:hypothetical protein
MSPCPRHVPRSGDRAADRVAPRGDLDPVADPVEAVADRRAAVRPDADVVAKDPDPGRAGVQLDAVVEVPRDHVALARAGSADRDVRDLDADPVVAVAGSRVAGPVGAEPVPLDDVAAAAVDDDAVVAEAG